MNKKYIIKIYKEDYRASYITGKDLSYLTRPYYLSEVYVGYTNENNHTVKFSYNTVTSKEHAMIYNSVEEAKMVLEFIRTYNKIHHKVYKIEMEKYTNESRSI